MISNTVYPRVRKREKAKMIILIICISSIYEATPGMFSYFAILLQQHRFIFSPDFHINFFSRNMTIITKEPPLTIFFNVRRTSCSLFSYVLARLNLKIQEIRRLDFHPAAYERELNNVERCFSSINIYVCFIFHRKYSPSAAMFGYGIFVFHSITLMILNESMKFL